MQANEEKIMSVNWKLDNPINIKQHSQVTYIGCVLDKTMSGKPMAIKGYEQNKWEIKVSL